MTTKPTRWLASRLGRRGAALAVLGVLFLLIGFQAGVTPAATELGPRFLLHTMLPAPIEALLWVVPGSLALWASVHKGPGPDGFGFNALVVPVILQIVSYLISFIAFLTGASTWPYALATALIWLAVLALVLIIAGWAEVPTGYRPRRGWRHPRD